MAKHSQGFTTLEIVIVLVFVIAAALGGWYVWGKHHQHGAHKSNTVTQSAGKQTTQQTQTITDPSEGGKYLVIEAWRVRILLPQELRGQAHYSLRQFNESYGKAEAADIGIESFSPECHDSTEDLGLALIRTTVELGENAPYVYKRNILHEGDYWYHAIFGKDGCAKLLSGAKATQFNELYQSLGAAQSY